MKPDQIKIEEWNRLIAEFMGETGLTKVSGDILVPYTPAYHLLWQSLMPVGKKIRVILTEMHKSMPPNTANKGDLIEVDISCRLMEYDILKTHEHIVQFIQWYNQNNKL